MQRSIFGALDALTVDERGARQRLTLRQFVAFDVEDMVDAIQRAIVVPQPE